jgi:hypothetical protein
MNKINIIQAKDHEYYLEVCNDTNDFLTIRVKLTINELSNLEAVIKTIISNGV